MSLVDEDDLVVLCSKLKPFQSKLLRKWVQGLGAEQRAAAFMKDVSAAKNHSTSPPLEDKGAEDEDEEENGDEDADADENSLETFCLWSPGSCGVQLALQMLDLRKVQSGSIARDKSISEKCRGR